MYFRRDICLGEKLLYRLLTGNTDPEQSFYDNCYALNEIGDGNFGLAGKSENPDVVKRPISDVYLKDIDGVPILATYYESSSGYSWEINTWKVDFSPILSIKGAVDNYTGISNE